MSKILIITSIFPPEPVVSANLSKDIAFELSKANEVTVICPPPSRPLGFQFKEFNTQKKYKIVRLNSFICPASKLVGRFRESYSFGKACVKYLKENYKGTDIIYINSWPLISQYLIIKTAWKYNIPTITHVQDIYPESLIGKLPFFFKNLFYHLLLPFDKFILRKTTKILCISSSMITYLSSTRKINIAKFLLVRNWQDDEIFLNYIAPKNVSNFFVFMYVGSISASAGVDLLIKAFHDTKLTKSKLIIVGDGSEKDTCLQLVERLNNPNIEFKSVEPTFVPEMQSMANILLLPLRKGISKTATPSKLTAYLFSGKPIIACVEIESDVANILKNNACGFVVDPENIQSLSSMMKQVFDMKKAALDKMGENGREFAKNNLSRNINLTKIQNVVSALITNPPVLN